MLRQLEQIPYVKDLVKRLRRDKGMRSACGYCEKVPTEAHFSQMKKRVGFQARAAARRLLMCGYSVLKNKKPYYDQA
jgi:hypothetical protein